MTTEGGFFTASRLGGTAALFWVLVIGSAPAALAARAEMRTGALRVTVKQTERDQPLPCRVHLTVNGKPFYAPGCPRWERDADFCCDGTFTAQVPTGKAELLFERGPEWNSHAETVEVEPGATRTLAVALSRWIDMNARGWYSGDLHVHRPPDDMPLLLRAEDLNVAPDLTYWNQRKADVAPPYLREVQDSEGGSARPRFYHTLNQEDERNGGALLFFNLRRPLAVENVYQYWPSGMPYQRAALEQNAHVEQEKPFWWEAPVNVALGKVDTMGIVHNHFQRRGMMENEAWGRPRDPVQYPGKMGFCLYTLELYYRYLNLGWDLPVSAGSASGVLANPVGYNRVYVRLDRFDYENWFEALRAGNSFATNGPLLFATVNGKPIGTRFDVEAGRPFEATVEFEAASREPLDRVEIVMGGQVVRTCRPAPGAGNRISGKERLPVAGSTWIAVRAFAANDTTVRFAHTSPFYVTAGGEKRRNAEAARFLVQWMDDLTAKTKTERARFRQAGDMNELLETYAQARAVYARLAQMEGTPGRN